MLVSSKMPEIQVSLHPHFPITERRKVRTSREVYDLIIDVWNKNTMTLFEEFMTLYLARNNAIIGYRNISRGSNCGTVVNIQLILGIALKVNASSIILVHNHPSGNLKPSRVDRDITDKLNNASRFLDIGLLDHIIVTSQNYFSFADEGLIFDP